MVGRIGFGWQPVAPGGGGRLWWLAAVGSCVAVLGLKYPLLARLAQAGFVCSPASNITFAIAVIGVLHVLLGITILTW